MLSQLKEFVNGKIKEFAENKKVIPDHWVPILDVIKIACKLVEFFVPDNVDQVLGEIIVAIDTFENLP
jgi:hypothetical protein